MAARRRRKAEVLVVSSSSSSSSSSESDDDAPPAPGPSRHRRTANRQRSSRRTEPTRSRNRRAPPTRNPSADLFASSPPKRQPNPTRKRRKDRSASSSSSSSSSDEEDGDDDDDDEDEVRPTMDRRRPEKRRRQVHVSPPPPPPPRQRIGRAPAPGQKRRPREDVPVVVPSKSDGLSDSDDSDESTPRPRRRRKSPVETDANDDEDEDAEEEEQEEDVAVVEDDEEDNQDAAADRMNEALAQVLLLFPDVLPSHAENLLAVHADDLGGNYAAAIETVVALLVDDPAYPRVGEDAAEATNQNEEAMDWLDVPARLREGEKPDPRYKSHALDLLMDSFRDLPIKLLKTEFAQRSHFFAPTFYALTTSDRNGDFTTKKLKRPRPAPKTRFTLVAVTELDEETGEEVTRHEAREDEVPELLAREKRWVEDKIAREDEERLCQKLADQLAERERKRAENLDKRARRRGIAVECQCCFDDIAVENTTTCADGHLFCKTCAAANANTRLGQLQATLPCMAADCPALFLPITYSSFLPAVTIDALADLAQQKDLETAFDGVEGFEKCPFCPFACFIESKMEKLFRCLRAECRKVSCRECKLENHIPKTCEEVAKERSLASVHGVEEAMTAALIKNCPKCKVPTCKQDGCNKMTCSSCGVYWCHRCGEQITGYEHFSDENYGGKNPDGCPTFDNTTAREREAIEAARLRAQVDLDDDAREAAEKLAETSLDHARRDQEDVGAQDEEEDDDEEEEEEHRAQVEAAAEAARQAQAQARALRQAHRRAQQQAQRQAQRQQQRQAHRQRQRQAQQQAQAQAAYVAYVQAQAQEAHRAYAAQQQAEAYQAYVAQQQRQQAEERAYAAHQQAQAQAAQRVYVAQQQRHAQHRAQAEANYRAYMAQQYAQAPPTPEEMYAAEVREQQQARRRVQERARAQAQETATWHAAMANAQNAINNVWANFAGAWRGW